MANGITQSSPFSRAKGAASPKGTLQGLGFSPLIATPPGLTPLDAGRLWWRNDLQEFNYYDGATVKGFGGSLQDAYDLGNTINVANDLAVQVLRSTEIPTGAIPNVVSYEVGGSIHQLGSPTPIPSDSLFNAIETVALSPTTTDISFTVTSPTQIDFGAAIDLVTLNANIPGINSVGGAPTQILIKSTDISPTDEGVYTIVGSASSGGGTNNEAILVDENTGLPATLTSTSGTATVFSPLNISSPFGNIIIGANRNVIPSAKEFIINDGGAFDSLELVVNLPKLPQGNTAFNTALFQWENADNSGFSDVPILYLNNDADAGDIRFTNRIGDPTTLGAGDEGQLWYNATDNLFKFWDGSSVIPLGGDTLQSAYDAGNSIQGTTARPFQVIDSTSDVYGGNTQGYLNIREDSEAVFRGSLAAPFLYRRIRTINVDSAVTLIAGTNQVEFGAGVDLIAQGHNVFGVNYNSILGAVLYIKSAANPVDEDLYQISAVANGAGTNSIAVVTRVGPPPSFTAGAAVATTGNSAQVYSDNDHLVLGGNTTVGLVLDRIFNDGGVLTNGLSLIENTATGSANTSVGDYIQSIVNSDTSGNSDVPLQIYENQANAADVQYTARVGDPIGLSVDGQSWYNDTESRLKVRANGTNESIAYLSDIAPGTNPWVNVAGAAQTIAPNTNYVANSGGLVTFTLPATAAFGDTFVIMGNNAAGWTITQNAGQTISVGNATSTVGVGGSLTSTQVGDTLKFVCVNANTDFRAFAVQGNPNII